MELWCNSIGGGGTLAAEFTGGRNIWRKICRPILGYKLGVIWGYERTVAETLDTITPKEYMNQLANAGDTSI